jgi:PAS domain S-box-containing protein
MLKKLINELSETGIIESIGDAISIQDTNFKIIYQNKVTKDMWGDQVGEYCYKAYHDRDHVCEKCQIAMSFSDGKSHRVEQSVTKDKKIIYSENVASPLRDSTGKIIAAIEAVRDITERKRAENMLRSIAAKISVKTGEEYFRLLTEFISKELGTEYALVGELDTDDNKIKTIAVYDNGKIANNIEYDLAGSPCDNVIGKKAVVYTLGIQELFPEDKLLVDMGAESYAAIPLFASDRKPLGIIAALGCSPIKKEDKDRSISLLQIFSVRASAELERKKSEEALKSARNDLEIRVQERTSELLTANKELEESNTALKVLLRQRGNDKEEFEENILANIKHLILPYIEKLKKNKPMSDELAILNLIGTNLKEIVSPFSSKLSFKYLDLTPKEILIANLIKDGKQDKDIADILHISLETVKSHRQNIRKKLGIYGKRTNLRTKLSSLID